MDSDFGIVRFADLKDIKYVVDLSKKEKIGRAHV